MVSEKKNIFEILANQKVAAMSNWWMKQNHIQSVQDHPRNISVYF